MNLETVKDIEAFLCVGNPLFFYGDPRLKHGPRYHSVIRGWQRSAHILIDRPKSANGGFAPLQEGQECSARFLSDGSACGFDSQVIDWSTRRYLPFARLRWPREMKSVAYRKFERVKVRLACVVLEDNGRESPQEIRDLSLGGCSILSHQPYDAGTPLGISFCLPDTTRIPRVETVVRTCTARGTSYCLGCAFTEGQDFVLSDIAFYVVALLELQRGGPIDSAQDIRRVLLIDANTDTCLRLRDVAEDNGFEALMAANPIDGIHRLRMAPAQAVLINAAMPAPEICRILRTDPVYARLPVVVYGYPNAESAGMARAAGATAVILEGGTMIEDTLRTLQKEFKHNMRENTPERA